MPRAVIAAAFALMGIGLSCGPKMEPIQPVVRSPWQDWIVLNEPLERMILGAAWDGSGIPDTGCYTYGDTSTVGGEGWEKYTLRWADTTSKSLRLGVAKAFGFGASINQAATGEIRVSGLKSLFATNVGALGNCIVSTAGLPRYPAVYALIGADSVVFDFKTHQGTAVDASVDFKREGGKVGFHSSRDRGTTAAFGSTRWVGARFVGLVAVESIQDTLWTGHFPFNQFRPLRWNFEATVAPVSDGAQVSGPFRVIIHRQIPLVWDTLVVAEGQTFAFGLPRTQLVRGEFFLGRVHIDAAGNAAALRVERRVFREMLFDRNEMRDSLTRWARRP